MFDLILGGIVALLIAVYLVFALLYPREAVRIRARWRAPLTRTLP